MPRSKMAVEATRKLLWGDRETLLPHLVSKCCDIGRTVDTLCAKAGWTYESYVLAAVFDREDLLVEVTK